MPDNDVIMTGKEVAAMLRMHSRSLERRHAWSPAFPQPLTRKPLTFLRSAVLDWIERRNRLVQRAAA